MEGVFEKGGIACVLHTESGAWIGSQDPGEPRSDFFISTRQACELHVKSDSLLDDFAPTRVPSCSHRHVAPPVYFEK
jgi:hypothetical protein